MNKQIYICIVSSETQTPVVPQRKREKWDGTHASNGREAGDDVYVGNSCLLRSRHCSVVVFAEKEGREQGQGVKAKVSLEGLGAGWGGGGFINVIVLLGVVGAISCSQWSFVHITAPHRLSLDVCGGAAKNSGLPAPNPSHNS